ncbi:TonB-dependent receptor plug domain-containing protein [Phenylobacterium sp.]|uniref:TonB-dependent receptor plug domain-containing protein n=1 Tax=Phenylobacterium sp. TaxID=1871053 RepID=UPI0035641AFD
MPSSVAARTIGGSRRRAAAGVLFATALTLALAGLAPAAAAQGAAVGGSLISYRPDFFTAQNPNNALDMVNRLPGFSLDTGDSVRGFEGAAGNVLIDSQRPSSKSDTLDQILQRIPASKVERIDVIRGGAPGIDMQGKTVIANVILKKGGAARGLLAVSNYTLNDRRDFLGVRAEASGAWGDRSWEGAIRGGAGPDDGVSKGRSQIIFADGRPTEVALLDSKGLDLNGSATGSFETPLLGGRLRVNGRLYQEKFKEPELDRIIAPTPEIQTFGYVQKTTDTEVGGRFTRAFGPSTNLELVGLHTTRDRDTDSLSDISGSASDFFAKEQSSETILRGVLKRRFGQTISVEAGAEGADNKLDSRTRFTIDAVAQVLPAANVEVEEKRTEVFAKATWRPSAKWTVDGALRYESSDISSAGDVVLSKSLQFAKPRLAVTWAPIASTQFRLRFERSIGQLDFNDFVASSNLTSSVGITVGNPDLNPQQAWVSEAAIEQQLWKGASLLLTGRHQKLTDVVDRGPVFASDGTVFDRPTNIGEGTEDDLILDFTLPFDQLGWHGAMIKGEVMRRWSAVTDPTTGEKREISGLHPNDWNVTFSQDLPREKLSLGVDVFGGFRRNYYRFNLIETFKLQTYVRPYIEWKPTQAWSLRMELPLVTAPQVRLRDTFEIFPGPRSAGGRPDIQDRQFHFPHGIYLRVLKNFG